MPEGSRYKAYLIMDEKTLPVDTIRKGFPDRQTRKIDRVVVNHIGKDRSGALYEVMKVAKDGIFRTDRTKKGLIDAYGGGWQITTVNIGGLLSIGKGTLKFIETHGALA